jgi:hypothetical protein
LDHVIEKNELFQKLETMDKSNLDRVCGFIECLIVQREFVREDPNKRKPLLARKKHDE